MLKIKMEDVKIKLAALWLSRILTGFLGDILRFFQTETIESILTGNLEVGFQMTNGVLLLMTIVIGIPIYMIFPSLVLKYKANRRLNLIVGSFMVLFDIFFLILSIFMFAPIAFEILLGIIYLIFTSFVVRYAWKWKNIEN